MPKKKQAKARIKGKEKRVLGLRETAKIMGANQVVRVGKKQIGSPLELSAIADRVATIMLTSRKKDIGNKVVSD